MCLRLLALTRVLRGEVDDGGHIEREWLRDGLARWAALLETGGALAESFETAMSPARLFDRPPLSRCDEATRSWLVPLLHQHWREQVGADALVEAARRALEEGRRAGRALEARVEGVSPEARRAVLRESAPLVEALAEACQRIAAAFERFPRTLGLG